MEKIDKKQVISLIDNYFVDDLDKAYIISEINALPTSDGWVWVEMQRPPSVQYILTWDGQGIIYRSLSKGHDVMPLADFKKHTKITHWMIPTPPTK